MEHTKGKWEITNDMQIEAKTPTCIKVIATINRHKDCCQANARLIASSPTMRNDIDNAVKYAKEYEPDYPWQLNTASEAIWALGEGKKGVEQANNDLHKVNKELLEACKQLTGKFEFALKKLQGEKAVKVSKSCGIIKFAEQAIAKAEGK